VECLPAAFFSGEEERYEVRSRANGKLGKASHLLSLEKRTIWLLFPL
jgi:hypothetical protein